MRIARLGEGEPELSIIGGIHGDEPCGVRAIDRLLDDRPPLDRAVKLVVANEEALSRGVRYIDADLNRAFDGSTAESVHERRLADALREELAGTTAMAIHSTQSYDDPFAITSGVGETVEAIVPRLTVDALVDAGKTVNGRIFETAATIIEVEAGTQGTEAAAENAYRLAREFLTATGALPGDTVPTDVPTFELGAPIPKPPASEYGVLAQNFTRVGAGEPFATADDERITADTPFWPVLLSAHGYQDIFGYRSQRTGELRSA
jgi:predicted deacylase